jgi:hypothetical protein
MLEVDAEKDDLNPYPWYDIVCGTCDWIIATVRIVPDEKPREPSAAPRLGGRAPRRRQLGEFH